jgi:Flp pilus assembly CpaE family ATPase
MMAIKRTAYTKNKLTVLPVSSICGTRQMLPFNDYTELEIKGMIKNLIHGALKEYQIVIVDTNPIIDDAAVNPVLKEADTILFLMEATEIFLDSACAYLDIFKRLYLENKVKYIINKHSKHDPVSIRLIEETLESDVIGVIPNDTDGYRHAAHKGKPYKPQKGVSPWSSLADELLKINQISVIMVQEKPSILKSLLLFKK